MKEPFSFKLSSDPENIALLEAFLSDLTRQYTIDSEIYSNILISLTEAVNNAIYHGNECDSEKMIQIIHLYKETTNKLIFKVQHKGKGFDPEKVPDPTKQENVNKDGGRGVHLMKALSEELHYHDNGRTVEIHFKIT